jgi:hypothetical protein
VPSRDRMPLVLCCQLRANRGLCIGGLTSRQPCCLSQWAPRASTIADAPQSEVIALEFPWLTFYYSFPSPLLHRGVQSRLTVLCRVLTRTNFYSGANDSYHESLRVLVNYLYNNSRCCSLHSVEAIRCCVCNWAPNETNIGTPLT